MKLVLYIRGAKGGKVDMRTFVEAEPCYDNPRVANLASEVRAILDEAIRTGEEAGAVYCRQRNQNSNQKGTPSK